jgi:hypothetical protein
MNFVQMHPAESVITSFVIFIAALILINARHKNTTKQKAP